MFIIKISCHGIMVKCLDVGEYEHMKLHKPNQFLHNVIKSTITHVTLFFFVYYRLLFLWMAFSSRFVFFFFFFLLCTFAIKYISCSCNNNNNNTKCAHKIVVVNKIRVKTVNHVFQLIREWFCMNFNFRCNASSVGMLFCARYYFYLQHQYQQRQEKQQCGIMQKIEWVLCQVNALDCAHAHIHTIYGCRVSRESTCCWCV